MSLQEKLFYLTHGYENFYPCNLFSCFLLLLLVIKLLQISLKCINHLSKRESSDCKIHKVKIYTRPRIFGNLPKQTRFQESLGGKFGGMLQVNVPALVKKIRGLGEAMETT